MKRTTHVHEKITCPSCSAHNSRFAAFCHKCGSPIGAVATIDPMQSIRADAFALNKAIDGPPRLSVLLVVGIPALVVVIGSTIIAFKTLLYEGGGAGFIYFWLLMGAAILGFLFLHRVTKNYFTKRKQQHQRKKQQKR